MDNTENVAVTTETEVAAQSAAAETAPEATAPETPQPEQPSEPEAPVSEEPKTEEEPTPEEATSSAEEPDYKALNEALKAQLAQTMARAAAVQAGVKPERAEYALKLAELSGIDPTAKDAQEMFDAAIGKVLEALPELKATPAGTGSKGNPPRAAAKLDPFLQGLKS